MLTLLAALLVGSAVQAGPGITSGQAVEKARQTLAEHLRVPAGRVETREVTAMKWPDTGLGCPSPGQIHAQVITPGFRVVLAVDRQVYRVHVSLTRAVVCGAGLRVSDAPATAQGEPLRPGDVPIPEPIEPKARQLISDAKSDLASRTSAPNEMIELIGYESVTWPDRSLGCPRPGIEFPQVRVEGVRIRLALKGLAYEYHAGGGRGPFLCEPEVRKR